MALGMFKLIEEITITFSDFYLFFSMAFPTCVDLRSVTFTRALVNKIPETFQTQFHWLFTIHQGFLYKKRFPKFWLK